MLRCADLNLDTETLRSIPMGLVYDMLIEKANDQEEYPYKATQKDIEDFFGR